MEVTAIIEFGRGGDEFDMAISNYDNTVKIQAPELFEGAVYIDRQDLIRALMALDVAS